ncbi:N-acetylneuraminate synthase family protein [Thalassospira sp. HJ]|uniref:N-acetylneuraminate synthase family protein n=1 Tax=Thalassospira sp. HJ TaxID=1616823 RepID=UPI0005CF0B2E|nr:N-acetylneuraminate synthase family protein [Thalassospira sp. HJ]
MKTVAKFTFSREMQPFIIAEIGNNHEGDFVRAKELLIAAAEAGVDAVKFQSITPQKLVTSDQVDRIEKLRKFSLNWEQFAELSELADKKGVVFFSTPFDVEAVDRLDKLQKIFKISSGDNTFSDLVQEIAQRGKPTLISTGGMTHDEIIQLHQFFLNAAITPAELILLHCISLYPTCPVDAQLWRIKWLNDHFNGITVGYSDHTLGIEACKIAVTLGARVLEKHFTLDKNQSDFRDHQLSADPQEMAKLVQECRAVMDYLGKPSDIRPDRDMHGVRRVAVAARDIAVGTVIQASDLTWLRSLDTSALKNPDAVLCRRVAVSISKGEPLSERHFNKG